MGHELSGPATDAVSVRQSLTGRLVAWCSGHAWLVAGMGLALGLVAASFAARHFAMSTDTGTLLSPRLQWRIREAASNRVFSRKALAIVVVIDGQTPELAEAATAALAQHLNEQPRLF